MSRHPPHPGTPCTPCTPLHHPPVPGARQTKDTMTILTLDRTQRPLVSSPHQFDNQPFYADTATLLRSFCDNDRESLTWLCDADLDTVTFDPFGTTQVVRSLLEWERWLHEVCATIDTMGAETDSVIVGYHAARGDTLGFSVVEFHQTVSVDDLTASYDCNATIVWKRTARGWRMARWHCSVISSDVPEALVRRAVSQPRSRVM